MKISSIFVAFLENMNFNRDLRVRLRYGRNLNGLGFKLWYRFDWSLGMSGNGNTRNWRIDNGSSPWNCQRMQGSQLGKPTSLITHSPHYSQIIFQFYWGLFEGCTNRAWPIQPIGRFLKNCNLIFGGPNTFIWRAMKVSFSGFIQNMSRALSKFIKVDRWDYLRGIEKLFLIWVPMNP